MLIYHKENEQLYLTEVELSVGKEKSRVNTFPKKIDDVLEKHRDNVSLLQDERTVFVTGLGYAGIAYEGKFEPRKELEQYLPKAEIKEKKVEENDALISYLEEMQKDNFKNYNKRGLVWLLRYDDIMPPSFIKQVQEKVQEKLKRFEYIPNMAKKEKTTPELFIQKEKEDILSDFRKMHKEDLKKELPPNFIEQAKEKLKEKQKIFITEEKEDEEIDYEQNRSKTLKNF